MKIKKLPRCAVYWNAILRASAASSASILPYRRKHEEGQPPWCWIAGAGTYRDRNGSVSSELTSEHFWKDNRKHWIEYDRYVRWNDGCEVRSWSEVTVVKWLCFKKNVKVWFTKLMSASINNLDLNKKVYNWIDIGCSESL